METQQMEPEQHARKRRRLARGLSRGISLRSLSLTRSTSFGRSLSLGGDERMEWKELGNLLKRTSTLNTVGTIGSQDRSWLDQTWHGAWPHEELGATAAAAAAAPSQQQEQQQGEMHAFDPLPLASTPKLGRCDSLDEVQVDLKRDRSMIEHLLDLCGSAHDESLRGATIPVKVLPTAEEKVHQEQHHHHVHHDQHQHHQHHALSKRENDEAEEAAELALLEAEHRENLVVSTLEVEDEDEDDGDRAAGEHEGEHESRDATEEEDEETDGEAEAARREVARLEELAAVELARRRAEQQAAQLANMQAGKQAAAAQRMRASARLRVRVARSAAVPLPAAATALTASSSCSRKRRALADPATPAPKRRAAARAAAALATEAATEAAEGDAGSAGDGSVRGRRPTREFSEDGSLAAYSEFHRLVSRHLKLSEKKGFRQRDFKRLCEYITRRRPSSDMQQLCRNFRQEIKKLYGERRRRTQIDAWSELQRLTKTRPAAAAKLGPEEQRALALSIAPQVQAKLRAWFCDARHFSEEFFDQLAAFLAARLSTGKKSAGSAMEMPRVVRDTMVRMHQLPEFGGSGFSLNDKYFGRLVTESEMTIVVLSSCNCGECLEEWGAGTIVNRAVEANVRLHWTRRKALQSHHLLELHKECGECIPMSRVNAIPTMRHWTRQDVDNALRSIHAPNSCNICLTAKARVRRG